MKKILIVNANYYKEISKKLVISAQKKLIYKRYKVTLLIYLVLRVLSNKKKY